ncbi:DNA-binding NarL/FixJ family response regulator [Nonomuraea thailandensis]|uniref:DNA-binding NarL/FixJ family response regulator n=1 Tax=Nonomuraea thailandensis TaxID=1188745 RepID=A0A9X2GG83_9ACTN|nr:DNA-binding NarL/FixJ family response regulator [Nonomuraea thailandensis]
MLVLTTYDGDDDVLPAVAARVLRRVREPAARAAELSEREHSVLRLVAGGATNREAAAALFISETTVKTHLAHIYTKLGVSDRAAAAATAYARGLLP